MIKGNEVVQSQNRVVEASPGFPLGLENQENLEKWEGIFQSGKSQGILTRLEKSGKIIQKYWKTEGISDKYYMLFFSDC